VPSRQTQLNRGVVWVTLKEKESHNGAEQLSTASNRHAFPYVPNGFVE
jgi:hypothetical protein